MLRTKNHNRAPRYRDAGEWLRKQRQYWQITQAELAEQAGINDPSLIERIEQGSVALPSCMQAAVAAAYGLERDELAAYCEDWYGEETAKAA